jgi:hypothetical protein
MRILEDQRGHVRRASRARQHSFYLAWHNARLPTITLL